MKNLLLVIVFIFCISVVIKGQEKEESYSKSKHEFSIVLDDIFIKNNFIYYPPPIYYTIDGYIPINYPDYSSTLIYNMPKVGLGYKYYFQNSAIRSKLSIGVGNHETDDKNSQRQFSISQQVSNFNIGYEFHKNINKTQIFYGLDLMLNISETSSKSRRYGENSYTSETINSLTGFGISPLLGVKYYFNPSISLSTEIKYTVESYSGERVYKYSEAEEDNKTTIGGLDTRFGPLGQISVNIHF